MSKLATAGMIAALVAAPAAAKTKAKITVDGAEYGVTVRDDGQAVATLTGFRAWGNRVGDWKKAVTAIEQVSGCTAAHVTIERANGGVPVGVWVLLDCDPRGE